MSLFKITKLVLLITFCISASAQKKEGNIVEYFGKEKVNNVSEGEVVYLFKEGLILETSGIPFSNSAVQYDPIFAKFLLHGFDIKEGKEEYDNFKNEKYPGVSSSSHFMKIL